MKPTFHSRVFLLGTFPCFLDTGNWFGGDWRCKREQTSPQNSWLQESHLEKIPTFSVAADADTAGRKVFPPQHVIESGLNTSSQIPVRGLNRGITPVIRTRLPA